MPILYLDTSETIKPEQYLKTVDNTNQLITKDIDFKTLSEYKASPAMNMKSKFENPKKFWQNYQYSDVLIIPLYHTAQAKQLLDPKTGVTQNYIERNFMVIISEVGSV